MATNFPQEVKAYLGQLKEVILDSECNDLKTAFQALVLLELVHRGVLPLATAKDDVSKIIEAVRSTAGKPLLDGSTIVPKPLLAGACAMSGMVAEKCAKLLPHQSIHTGLLEAIGRCKDVDDQRLLCLISVCKVDQDEQKHQLLQIAEAYFLRAASFQPDQPQMWKRAVDSIEARTNLVEPLEAAFPLGNLIRIAESKGNMRRVSELSLSLAESWLSLPMEDNLEITRIFTAPFRPKSLQPSRENARNSLQKCDGAVIGDTEILWYAQIALRIELDEEVATVEALADEKYQTAKNRGVYTTLQACREAAKSKVLVDSIGTDNCLQTTAIKLRDSLLNRLEGGKWKAEKFESSILHLQRFVERLQTRAQLAGITSLQAKSSCKSEVAFKFWVALLNFLNPVIQSVSAICKWNTAKERRKEQLLETLSTFEEFVLIFFESCSLSLSTCFWMTCGQRDDLMQPQDLCFLYDLISCLSESAVLRNKLREEPLPESAIVMTSDEPGKRNRLAFESSSLGIFAMLQIIVDTVLTQKLIDDALLFAENWRRNADSSSRFGTSYFLLLKVWSGLQHTPWSYCNVTQARSVIRAARRCQENSKTDWGRQSSLLESILVDVAEADAEGGFLVGGLSSVAARLYHDCLERVTTLARVDIALIVSSHCLAGLSRLTLAGFDVNLHGTNKSMKTMIELSEDFARLSLDRAEGVDSSAPVGGLYLGTQIALASAKSYHKSLARQLVADALIRGGRSDDAEVFLEAAVAETPEDFDAALALGVFRLRTAFFPSFGQPPSSAKIAQTQLLKAAKLNSAKASPFALLGFWYEQKEDKKRAIGCYSKALQLDPTHPVAGRGMLRLKSFLDIESICSDATKANSPLNGWAWRAMGIHKAMSTGDNEMAVICFQEALRCMDTSTPHNESTSLFFLPPNSTGEAFVEVAAVWSDLASCYRRLGRYSAAIRAFNSAWESSSQLLPPTLLVSWAQIELEVGLVDDAAEKFGLALEQKDESVLEVASYGRGCALLSVARRDAQDGKAGAAYSSLLKAIDVVKRSMTSSIDGSSNFEFVSVLKLLGDMYTYGAILPPDVFGDQNHDNKATLEQKMILVRNQISFVKEGEKCYASAEAKVDKNKDNAYPFLAALACDVGTNILSQAQLLSALNGEGQGLAANLSLSETMLLPEVQDAFDRSSDAFRRSIDWDPLFAPAWCGLGCAAAGSIPLLAQHAFARAIQLDKSLADSWANLGFLYASRHAFKGASAVMDELTQIADTPMMWICRAGMLEREWLEQSESEAVVRMQKLGQAADAYRAALQVMKEPAALLGIGMTCRVATSKESEQQSYAFITEFIGSAGGHFSGPSLLNNAMSVEAIEAKGSEGSNTWRHHALEKLSVEIDEASTESERIFPASPTESVLVDESKDGCVDCEIIRDLVQKIRAIRESSEVPLVMQSLQFEMMSNPNNGALWLALAKDLAKDLAKMIGNKKKRLVLQTIEAANLACNRAVQIFRAQIPSTSVKVNAFLVAETLSLSYCVKETEKELLQTLKDPPVLSMSNGYDIQRSLFLCPDNRLAREALLSR